MELSLPDRHITILKKLPCSITDSKQTTIKKIQSFLALANFASIICPVLKCLIKSWSWYLKKSSTTHCPRFQTHKRNIKCRKPLQKSIKKRLKKSFMKKSISMIIPQPSIQIFTDASSTGWNSILPKAQRKKVNDVLNSANYT